MTEDGPRNDETTTEYWLALHIPAKLEGQRGGNKNNNRTTVTINSTDSITSAQL